MLHDNDDPAISKCGKVITINSYSKWKCNGNERNEQQQTTGVVSESEEKLKKVLVCVCVSVKCNYTWCANEMKMNENSMKNLRQSLSPEICQWINTQMRLKWNRCFANWKCCFGNREVNDYMWGVRIGIHFSLACWTMACLSWELVVSCLTKFQASHIFINYCFFFFFSKARRHTPKIRGEKFWNAQKKTKMKIIF